MAAHEPGREAERGLVEHEQARRAHEGAADGHHLLLAARQRARPAGGGARAARGRARRRARGFGLRRCARAGREGAQLEVLRHGHAAEQPAALGHQRQAALHDLVRTQRAEIAGPPSGRARRAAAGGRRWSSAACVLPAPLGPRSATISPAPTVSVDAAQRAQVAVGGLEVAHLKHDAPPSRSPPRYASMHGGIGGDRRRRALGDLLARAQHDEAAAEVHQRPHDVLDHQHGDARRAAATG